MCLAVPGRVVTREERDGTTMAEVDFGGVRKDVCCQYIPDVATGDYVIVHVGFAIQRLDEESALRTLAEFERMSILEEQVEIVHRLWNEDTVTYEGQHYRFTLMTPEFSPPPSNLPPVPIAIACTMFS